MSVTTAGVDARGYLKGWAMALADMTSKDIRAIPADKWAATHGGCTKSALQVTVETISLLDWTTEALRGNASLADDTHKMAGLKAECASQDAAIARLKGAAAGFAVALSDASDEALNAIVTPPWRMDAPLFMIAQIAASHIWYHDGQLNYIQSLLGDDQIHWMDA